MKEKSIILAVLLIAAMFAMLIYPVVAWEYSDTWIGNPKTDNLWEPFGPRADKVQIQMYADEGAEFSALQQGLLDMTDWPITTNEYPTWTSLPLNTSIAVVDTGPEFGLYILDMRCNNDTYIQSFGPNILNPAFPVPNQYGNPMADVWLRRAISCVNNRTLFAYDIYSANTFPRLASPLYTDLSPAYGAWADPSLKPGGASQQWTYADANGMAMIAQGNAYLDAHGYVYDPVADCRKSQGGTYKFSIEFIIRSDDWHRSRAATDPGGVVDLMTKAPPNGLGMKNNLIVTPKTSGGAKADFMDTKKAHMYTGGWGLTIDPDHLYYLYSKVGYWHPGRPNNYAGYPGDLHDDYTVPTNGWTYTGFPANYSWVGSGFDFSDPAKTWKAGDVIDQNPANYWTREMMTALNEPRAKLACYKAQQFLAFWACGVPWWAAASNTAFKRTYSGGVTPPNPPAAPELKYYGHSWEGVVNQKGFGVWSTVSFLNMHTDNYEVGDGSAMIIRQGFRQPTLSLNPCYAEWVWDWYVLNLEVDSMIGADPYTLSNAQNLASSWDLSTWTSATYGTATNITFHMRHDLYWSDGVAITASDVKFTWGGPSVTGSLSNIIAVNGSLPPTYWSANLLDIVSVSTPDPWTVNVLLDTYAYFGLHSMSGFNLVLPEHVWKPLLLHGNPTYEFLDAAPVAVSGPWILEHQWDPTTHGGVLVLDKNVNYNMLFPPSSPQVPVPMIEWSDQTSNATVEIGNVHWIYPSLKQTAIQLTDTVTLHNYYVYKTGPNLADAHPYTVLDGLKTVELYKWSKAGSPNGGAYALVQTLETNVPVDLLRCQDVVEPFGPLTLTSGWYYFKVSFNITSLKYSDDGGLTYTTVSNANNIFFNHTKVYKEYCIVTSRYDIGGAFWQPSNLQPCADLKVNLQDTFSAALAFGSRPGLSNWNPAADVNGDQKVNLQDTFAISLAFGSVF